ncbi:17757_t:CDS:2, partial [Cetraspora pellucida]
FTGTEDKHTLSGDTVSESFMQSSIKTINTIAGDWCEYTIKSAPKLLLYRPDEVIQDLFDSI